MRVVVTFKGDWSYGLIQRAYRGDRDALAAIQIAYYEIILELRSGNSSIWSMGSDRDPDAFALDYPPLTAHFRKVSDDKVEIFEFEEQK
jgi:hypothetical protein